MFFSQVFGRLFGILKIFLIIALFFLVMIIWAMLFAEEELYLYPIEVITNTIDTNNLALITPVNQLLDKWNLSHSQGEGIADPTNFGYSIDKYYSITSVVKSDEIYQWNNFQYLFAVGTLYEGIDIMMFNEDDSYKTQSFLLQSPVIGIACVDYMIMVLTLNQEYTLDVSWYVYDNNFWELENNFTTDIQVGKVDHLYQLKDKGIFVSTKNNESVFFSSNTRDYKPIYNNITIKSIQGQKEFYVVFFEKDGKNVLDINFNDSFGISFEDTTNEFTANKHIIANSVGKVGEKNTLQNTSLITVLTESRSFELVANGKNYEVVFP